MKLVKLNREGGVLTGVLDDVKVIMIIAIIVGMTPAIVVTVLGAFNVTLPDTWKGGLQAPGLWVTSSLLIGAVVTIGLVSRIFPALSKLGGKKNNR